MPVIEPKLSSKMSAQAGVSQSGGSYGVNAALLDTEEAQGVTQSPPKASDGDRV